MSEHARELAQKLLHDLQAPVESLEILCSLLVSPLRALQLVDVARYSKYWIDSRHGQDPWQALDAHDKQFVLKIYWSQYQEVLATKIAVDWLDQLHKGGHDQDVWKPFLCPDLESAESSANAAQVARLGLGTLSTIISNKNFTQGLSSSARTWAPLNPIVRDIALDLLSNVVNQYPLKATYDKLLSGSSPAATSLLDWQAYVDTLAALPARVANLQSAAVPPNLEWRAFYCNLSKQFVSVNKLASLDTLSSDQLDGLVYVLTKVTRSGFASYAAGQSNFWSAILPGLRKQLLCQATQAATAIVWQKVLSALASTDVKSLALNLLACLDASLESTTDLSVKQTSMLLSQLLGSPDAAESGHLHSVLVGILLKRPWTQEMARVAVEWASSYEQHTLQGLANLMQSALVIWSEEEIIEKAPTSHHTYLTFMLLLAIRRLPALDAAIVKMSTSPTFLKAITSHLSTLRESVRLEGMLVAEEVSKKSLKPDGPIKSLDFGDIWAAEGRSFDDIRTLKTRLAQAEQSLDNVHWELDDQTDGEDEEPIDSQHDARIRGDSRGDAADVPKNSTSRLIQVMDTSEYDDYDEADEPDLKPFAMPMMPPAEDLKDLEDISAYTPSKKKPKPPVYIADLIAYLRSHDDADKIDIGLMAAAGLIRRKANWGTELSDAAVELAFLLSGLQDNFGLPQFEERRRDALIALMSCSPTRSAPALIEQFFTNHYSIHQRSTMLTTLALGARELAGLPSLPGLTGANPSESSFPTQRLPKKLHDRFTAPEPATSDSGVRDDLQVLTEDITNIALSHTRDSAEAHIPQAQREKLLTVRETKQTRMRPLRPESSTQTSQPAYSELAVTTFIMPMINRFWLYLRDVSTSTQDFRTGVFQGGNAGAATLLDPVILTKFLATMTILVEASRTSPHFLAVLAPETLQLVLAIQGLNSANTKVQSSMLQLVLVVLNGSTVMDQGRTLARDHHATIWQIKDWAGGAWQKNESQPDEALTKAAAGVLLRIDDITTKTIGYV